MAKCLQHNQPDPLPLKPLTWEKADYFWDWIQENLSTFDDYTPFSREEYERFLASPSCESYEIGDGVGLTTLIWDGINTFVQMIMLDWKFRDDVCREICRIAFEQGAERVTSTISADRGSARELVSRLGFVYEGRMRDAFERQGYKKFINDNILGQRYHSVEIWGLYKEVFQNGNGSSSSDSSSGGDRRGSDSKPGGLGGS